MRWLSRWRYRKVEGENQHQSCSLTPHLHSCMCTPLMHTHIQYLFKELMESWTWWCISFMPSLGWGGRGKRVTGTQQPASRFSERLLIQNKVEICRERYPVSVSGLARTHAHTRIHTHRSVSTHACENTHMYTTHKQLTESCWCGMVVRVSTA